MNKYQKAFKTILEDLHPDGGLTTLKEVELIEELIDKETPMKPIKLKCYRNEEYDACPKCNTNVYTNIYLGDHDYYLDRCEECGQRIDWND